MSDTTEPVDGNRIVSVSETGRVTIPERIREKYGISAPGRVTFVENDAGELVVRPVASMREFRGLERSDDERPATAVLRDSREADERWLDDLVERFNRDE